ncbi:MAG TPA: L-threonylcarbamoyladenylate synthase [Fibrobacteria bacterium]|nr:L-threonylcarbamoyladenylate synthase [Fibrobacteria bacterium]
MLPILPATPENLRLAASRLAAGDLVALPTETVYGLGAHALDPKALAKVFEAKRRPFFDPLIVHVGDRAWMPGLCSGIDPRAEALMDRFWPGPLTLVLPKSPAVPDLATSGLPTVAVRMPAHPVALGLLREAGFPVAAPSANPFGRLSPTEAAHVAAHFDSGIALILDGGPCAIGVESTILSLDGVTPVILRAGGLPREEIEAVIGKVDVLRRDPGRPLAPGQLPSHYAPRTPLSLLPGPAPAVPPAVGPTGLLAFREAPRGSRYAAVEVLSPAGDLREAAAGLFAALHRLDAGGLAVILAEPVPETGLGMAILDRLRKAAAAGEADHTI